MNRLTEPKLFLLDQNNAGGYFLPNLPERATITAKNINEAIKIAEMYGIDFDDGCEGCCGDRWYLSEYEPEIHGVVPDLIDELLKAVK